jgi:outer membrane protein OmpA-like peptidoglycan-associated protein
MSAKYSRVMLTLGLMGMSAAALAGEPRQGNPQEPAGFVTGAVIGAFAGGPIGAVVGAGLGTWLGNRVHRASEAKKAEAQLALMQTDNAALQTEKVALLDEKSQLLQTNQMLTAKLGDVTAKADASQVLDGLEGDVLFRTGSAEISPQIAHQVQVLAQAVSKSPALKIRIDGYADPRGTDDGNMKLSQDRANAVRDLLMAAGLDENVLEVNAYGKTMSVAADTDGYALERRVRLTLQIDGGGTVAQNEESPCCK